MLLAGGDQAGLFQRLHPRTLPHTQQVQRSIHRRTIEIAFEVCDLSSITFAPGITEEHRLQNVFSVSSVASHPVRCLKNAIPVCPEGALQFHLVLCTLWDFS